MASIQEHLDKIKNAVFGKDVRQAIHDSIKQCYDDAAVNHDNANMEVKLARGSHNTLNDRLVENEKNQEKISSQLDTVTTNHLDVNIRDFGAKCDGVTDDTMAFKAAINKIKENNGKSSLDLSFGTILISENIVIPPLVKIYGRGIYKTTIKAKEGVSILLDITSDGIYNNEFYDFTIDGSNIDDIKGILFDDKSNSVNDENCKFENILIVNCTDSFQVGSNNRGNRFTNINIEHCKNGLLINGTDNVITNCISSSIENDGIIINGSNNHVDLFKAFYCNKNGVVINGQINTFSGEVQENGLNGIVVNGFMNDISVVSDTNGRVSESHNVVVTGYKNIIKGMCSFNSSLSGNISSHLKMCDSVLNEIKLTCHGNKNYIHEECVSCSNNIIINKEKYIKNMLVDNMQLESVGVGQSFLKENSFYNKPWLVNYNKNVNQGCFYKKEITLTNETSFKGYLKAIVKGGNVCLIAEFYNGDNKLKTIESEILTIYHNQDSFVSIGGDIPNSSDKVVIYISLYATLNDGYSESILTDYGFNLF